MRLIPALPSLPHAGRVEVHYNGSWGTICSTDWDIQDANVICKQLGYIGAVATGRAVDTAEATIGDGIIWISGAMCKGTEASIGECSLQQVWGRTHCTHNEDVAVKCNSELVGNVLSFNCYMVRCR